MGLGNDKSIDRFGLREDSGIGHQDHEYAENFQLPQIQREGRL